MMSSMLTVWHEVPKSVIRWSEGVTSPGGGQVEFDGRL